jgi:hypothetical protein
MVLAVGVDVAEERKGLDLIALDGGGRIVASLDRATVAWTVGVIRELCADVVCIDSPPA